MVGLALAQVALPHDRTSVLGRLLIAQLPLGLVLASLALVGRWRGWRLFR